MPKRKSGLSTPNRSIASCHVMRGMTSGRSPTVASAASSTASLMASSTSSWSTKLISASSCMNSYWPVGAQVFVAQASRDLVIAIDASDHQQLFEELRRLRQRVERTWFLTRRDEELAGTFGSRRHQHGGLDFDEPLPLHGGADRAVDRGPYPQVALHAIASEVEVAIAQADVLVDLIGAVVDRERWRLGR
jgi:hypothetical protein